MYSNVSKYLGLKEEEKIHAITGDTPYYEPVKENYENSLTLNWKEDLVQTSNPYVWGPAFWLSFHISAVYYPINPSPIVRERLKQRILAIPYELPCSTCRPHAISFIEPYREKINKSTDKLDIVVSTRDNLVKFYVDFHNYVNERFNKKKWTYEEAEKVYSNKAKINYLSFKTDF